MSFGRDSINDEIESEKKKIQVIKMNNDDAMELHESIHQQRREKIAECCIVVTIFIFGMVVMWVAINIRGLDIPWI
jgi:hypothetical protein